MMSTDFKNITILNTHAVNYCCIIFDISKCAAMGLLKDVDLSEKKGDDYKI